MKLTDALAIVLDLAIQNMIEATPDDDVELREAAAEQNDATDRVATFLDELNGGSQAETAPEPKPVVHAVTLVEADAYFRGLGAETFAQTGFGDGRQRVYFDRNGLEVGHVFPALLPCAVQGLSEPRRWGFPKPQEYSLVTRERIR